MFSLVSCARLVVSSVFSTFTAPRSRLLGMFSASGMKQMFTGSGSAKKPRTGAAPDSGGASGSQTMGAAGGTSSAGSSGGPLNAQSGQSFAAAVQFRQRVIVEFIQ